MDNQQKYLLTGFGGALAIVILINAFASFGNNSTFWILLLAGIVSAMMLLIVNIFLTTKTIAVPADNGNHNDKHKKG
ncbi:MAG: hypothetical protein KDC07_00275 [Chitinophagaceae bacterium]|nr:hypothetical protein [Chitinophagaceae bacterium]